MSNHTPGPWTIYGDYSIMGNDRIMVADCNIFSRKRSAEDCANNAKIIAASPDLLATLEAALPLLEKCSHTHFNGDKVYKQAVEAVQKAKGGDHVG
jgi:hypothetical protein